MNRFNVWEERKIEPRNYLSQSVGTYPSQGTRVEIFRGRKPRNGCDEMYRFQVQPTGIK
jgi:hypothetical protein